MSTPSLFGNAEDASAVIDSSGRYRYRLRRAWDGDRPALNFLMLNPSKADAEADDPTIRRCLRFARDLGFGSIDVTNLFAWRATDPGELARASDAVGPENDRHILEAAGAAGMVVCAWGAFPAARPRAGAVVRLLRSASVKLHVLGWTTTPGVPRHPLFLPASARPIGAFFYDLLPPGEEGHLCADP